MRRKSHQQLGRYLAHRYLSHLSIPHTQAFLLGCMEPDWNPATYLKGSVRHQWLRGHNYTNAQRFMARISRRLEQKEHLSLMDCYRLGKLIHYVTDAFTLVHNDSTSGRLTDHRLYEDSLQIHFLNYLQENPQVDIPSANSVTEAISHCHRLYEQQEKALRTDARFALNACCCVLTVLLSPRII